MGSRRGAEPPPPSSNSRQGPFRWRIRAAAGAGAAAIAAAAGAIVLALSTGPTPPATGAASLIPADALLYVHVSTDRARPAVAQALARARRLPAAAVLFAEVTARLDAMLTGSGAAGVNFAAEVRPWLGKEAAFAVLDTSGASAGTLVVLDVRDPHRARAFLATTNAASDGSDRGVPLLRQPSGTVLAFVGHYLVLGQAASVAAAIDIAQRHAPSLADSPAYQRVAGAEAADRVLDLYAPAAGIARALLPRPGLLGALGVLLYQPALSATAVSLSPSPAGIRILVHSALDRKLIGRPAPLIDPSLADVLPAGSMLLLDTGDLRGAAPKLLAAAARVGVADRVAPFLSRLGRALTAQGVDLGRLFSTLGAESGFAVVPGGDGSAPAPVIVGRTARPAAARRELASLEYPLTQALAPPASGGGLVPVVSTTTVAGALVSKLTLAPGLQLDWAMSHGVVVLSTTLGGVAGVVRHSATLSDEPGYQATLGDHPGQVTSLVFFDLPRLLRLGEQTGLIGSTELEALRPSLEQIRAIGLASTRAEAETTTEVQLQIR